VRSRVRRNGSGPLVTAGRTGRRRLNLAPLARDRFGRLRRWPRQQGDTPPGGPGKPNPDRAGVPRLGAAGLGWLVAYAFALGLSHALVIAPAFVYMGFEDVPPDPFVAVALLPSYLLCARRLPASWERPSAVVYWILFLLVVAPIHVLPVFTTRLTTPVWLMVGSVAVAFWLLGFLYSVRLPPIARPTVTARLYWPAYALTWLVLLGVVVSYYGLRVQLLSLEEIYEVRDSYRASFEHVPRVARYAVTWLGNVVAPIALARGLATRRWAWVVAGVATELVLVSITGFKHLLFASVLVAAVVVLARTTDLRRLGRRVAALAVAGVCAVTAIDAGTGNFVLSSLFVRRLILTAAINTKYHFAYFQDRPKAMLGYGLLSRWVDYPYDRPPAFLVGEAYYGNPETSANANLWADAYANFGLAGVFGCTAVLALVLYLVDWIGRGLPTGLALAALAQSAVSLSNTAMLTVFLTHGMLLAVLLVAFMPEHVPKVRPSPIRPRTRRRPDPPDPGDSPTGNTPPGSESPSEPPSDPEPDPARESGSAPGPPTSQSHREREQTP
jgi:hypothetical protein